MRKALGRGLGALFPEAASEAGAGDGPLTVRVDDIVPNPAQPRRHFAAEAMAELAASIRRYGLLQPLVVRRVENGYELIAGERRLRAATEAGLEQVPIVVRDARPDERLELALIENLQREDLSPLEEAEAYRHLLDEYGFTQEEIAQRVGKSRPTITNALRLLGLPESVKAQVESGELSAGHARAVLAVDVAEQATFAREITTRKLSKNVAERLASARRGRPRARGANAGDVHLRALADELTRTFGTRVRIARGDRGGSVEIEFYSDAELERIIDRLRAVPQSRAAPARSDLSMGDSL